MEIYNNSYIDLSEGSNRIKKDAIDYLLKNTDFIIDNEYGYGDIDNFSIILILDNKISFWVYCCGAFLRYRKNITKDILKELDKGN